MSGGRGGGHGSSGSAMGEMVPRFRGQGGVKGENGVERPEKNR